ncbi:MAG: class I SAM-dependent methyltransferase [Planctomycetes bacterium]|nr:class I SAM-dependent methyltransferase [Planctomycetota bacterium]
MSWTRKISMSGVDANPGRELWECGEGGKIAASFPVEVSYGKPLNVLGLKGTNLDEVRQYAGFLQRTADSLYRGGAAMRRLENCPCCDSPSGPAIDDAKIFGVPYSRCPECGHAFVRQQPTLETIHSVFAESQEHSQTYVDRSAVEIRMNQIIKPKIDWAVRQYNRQFGRAFRTAIDVGAGGGHFVAGLKRAGVDAKGYEISKSSRAFAREAFDIELLGEDFLAAGQSDKAELITFWGLLEYTPDLLDFIRKAAGRLDRGCGMLVVETPRYDCLGTAIQKLCPQTVARHLDPTSHVNCFSDASLAGALDRCGFKPVAAWYFGMDVYELLVQQALRLDDKDVLGKMAFAIQPLQQCLDSARACDDIIVAAVPI